MPAEFSTRLHVRYQDTGPDLCMRPVALVGAMQEAAVLHAESVGQGIAWHAARHRVWMIVQTRARITRLPAWRAEIAVTTWPTEMGRLLARREFLVEDEQGEVVRATTLWAFIDTLARQVTRVPPEVQAAYPTAERQLLDRRLPRPPACPPGGRESRIVTRRRDIDSNGHVNNLRYLEWLEDSLPEELPSGRRLEEINIRYQRETLPGAVVLARTARLGDEPASRGTERVRLAHEIVLADSGERIASAETFWTSVQNPPAQAGTDEVS
jgi:acyl-ACP thioesterase